MINTEHKLLKSELEESEKKKQNMSVLPTQPHMHEPDFLKKIRFFLWFCPNNIDKQAIAVQKNIVKLTFFDISGCHNSHRIPLFCVKFVHMKTRIPTYYCVTLVPFWRTMGGGVSEIRHFRRT